MKYLIIILIALAFAAEELSAQNIMENKTILYPYQAQENRVVQIRNNYTKIKTGMTSLQVKSLLGEPDETRPLYEPKKLSPKQIGYTHWFLIQRKTDKGSEKDKDEKLVRVSYDLHWKVIGVGHWGFNEDNR